MVKQNDENVTSWSNGTMAVYHRGTGEHDAMSNTLAPKCPSPSPTC